MTGERELLAKKLRKQAASCGKLGSPLYESLLTEAANDVLVGGPTWDVLEPFVDEPPGAAVALKLMGAVHRVVLERGAPELATFYPNVGGTGQPAAAWSAFRDLLESERERITEGTARPVQTNEVGRSAALLGGFLELGRSTGLPLRLLEVGTSAGLNLRWDHYRYESEGAAWGPATSPVRFDVFAPAPPPLHGDVAVIERAGTDPNPLDPTSADDRLTLSSYVWPDQRLRWARLKGALDVASKVPAEIERAGAAEWLERKLSELRAGAATVVFHSVVMQYVGPDERDAVVRLMRAAGEAATTDAPLAWLRMEPPFADLGRFFATEYARTDVNDALFPEHPEAPPDMDGLAVVSLTTWPGGETRVIARAGYHGDPVVWLG
jgi:hypothetical protein